MRTEHGKIEGDLRVEDEFALHGIVTGSIRVRSGGTLWLHGICSKDLIVEAGGRAYTHGIVSGNAINLGGELNVYGIVSGKLSREGGTTTVSPDAIISGQRAG